MNTKYGDISDASYKDYYKKLIDKVYKILCLKEENCSTLDIYIESLLIDIVGQEKILKGNGNFLSLIGILETLSTSDYSLKIYKREVFKCINIIKLLEGGIE